MPDMFDYLQWRGDIRFSQLPPNPVDALVMTTLCYIQFDGIVPTTPYRWISLEDAAAAFLRDPECHRKVRVDADLELLAAAAATERFGHVGLSFYRDIFVPEEDTQFAALSWYLDDGSAFLSFRGTDNTMVGWKEDFNMTFLETIPAQRLAEQYVREFTAISQSPIHLGGHSKGGNLAIYAAAKSDPAVQKRFVWVYNQDGPGFMEEMMKDPGYLAIVPKIRTYVPQSSVFGMLLEHEEPHTIIKARQIGMLQHDPYNWEVMGGNFVLEKELTADSRFLDRTFKTWLAGMTTEERNEFFDAVFGLLMVGDTNHPWDLLRPQNLRSYIQNLATDGNIRKIIGTELENLIQSAKAVQLVDQETEK